MSEAAIEVRACPLCGGVMVYDIAWDQFSHAKPSGCVISGLEERVANLNRRLMLRDSQR